MSFKESDFGLDFLDFGFNAVPKSATVIWFKRFGGFQKLKLDFAEHVFHLKNCVCTAIFNSLILPCARGFSQELAVL